MDTCISDMGDGVTVSRGISLQYAPLQLNLHLKPKIELPQGIPKEEVALCLGSSRPGVFCVALELTKVLEL